MYIHYKLRFQQKDVYFYLKIIKAQTKIFNKYKFIKNNLNNIK
jgi:hypothetical protein